MTLNTLLTHCINCILYTFYTTWTVLRVLVVGKLFILGFFAFVKKYILSYHNMKIYLKFILPNPQIGEFNLENKMNFMIVVLQMVY